MVNNNSTSTETVKGQIKSLKIVSFSETTDSVAHHKRDEKVQIIYNQMSGFPVLYGVSNRSFQWFINGSQEW